MYLFWRWRDLGVVRHVALGVAVLALLGIDAAVVDLRAPATALAGSPSGALATPVRLAPHLRAEAVASGHGRIWLLARLGHAGTSVVQELLPRDLRVVRSIPVPRSAAGLYFGAGRVWVTGPGRITAVDPVGGASHSRRLPGTVASMAFQRSTAYAVIAGRDAVLALTPGPRLGLRVIEEVGGPRGLVALPRAVEVTNRDENLVPVILSGANTSYLAALDLGQPIIGSAGPTAAWVARGHLLVREWLGASARLARKYFPMPGHARLVLMDAAGGCYVAVAAPHRPALVYLSRAAIGAHGRRPLALRRGARVSSFALDPAGGVVYTTFGGHLRRWEPAAAALG